MLSFLLPRLQGMMMGPLTAKDSVFQMFNNWRDDTFDFVRHEVPRIVAVLIIAFILTRLLKAAARHLSDLSTHGSLPSAVRAQQLRTLSSVIYSVGVFIIMFLAAMQILPLLGINMGPLLASAGIAGLAVGFGAQTLVRDFINGFVILVENQYDISDSIRIAGVQGVVEAITLRRTVLRDGDGTVHNVPSSEIKVVSNLSRDWAQVVLHVLVTYAAASDLVIQLLQQIGDELASDTRFSGMILAKPEVPGIDKVSGDEVDYVLVVKTRPGSQDTVRRELLRRIKAAFEANRIAPGNPNRMYVVEAARPS